jgi:hypothetical protein
MVAIRLRNENVVRLGGAGFIRAEPPGVNQVDVRLPCMGVAHSFNPDEFSHSPICRPLKDAGMAPVRLAKA